MSGKSSKEEVEEEKVAEVPTAELDGKVCPRAGGLASSLRKT